MPARIIDGKAMSEEILRSIADRVAALQQKGVTPGLAVVLVGEDPASQIYVRNKQNACKQTGVCSKTIVLPADTTQEALESTIRALNDDPAIHGVLVQPMEKLDAWLETHTVDIAVLAVPANAAKATYERLVRGGVRGVWNFAPVDLNSSDEVAVVNVHLSDTLHILSYHLREQDEAESDADE